MEGGVPGRRGAETAAGKGAAQPAGQARKRAREPCTSPSRGGAPAQAHACSARQAAQWRGLFNTQRPDDV